MRIFQILVLISTFVFISLGVCAQTVSSTTPVEYYRLLNQANAFYDQRNYQKSEELLSKLININPSDGNLWFKLGSSKYNIKKYQESIELFKKAIDLGFYNRPVGYFSIARAYAMSGDKEMALQWLEKSLQAGYRNKTTIGETKAFESLSSDIRFRKLINAENLDALPRIQGWSDDIDYLVSEIKRAHYVYRKESLPESFIADVAKLKKQISTFSDQRIVIELQHLMAMIGDGHTVIYPFGMKHGIFMQMPLTLYSFSDGIFIIDAPEKSKELIGKKIVKFGNLSTETTLERLTPYITRDNPMSVKWFIPSYLILPDFLNVVGAINDSSKVSLTVENKEGKTETTIIEPVPVNPQNLILKILPPKSEIKPPLYLSRVDDNYWFEKISDDTVYFQFNQVMDKREESLENFALRLRTFLDENKIKNLIIDTRRNNGGNSNLLGELWRTLIHFDTSRKDAKIYVLIGRNTFSAAQNFINTTEKMTRAVFVGEPSGSKPNHIGDEVSFVLPYSGVIGQIAPAFHQSAIRDDRLWIVPQIPVELSSADYFANRDPILEATLKVIQEIKD